MSYRELVELSRKAADITASACASCAANDHDRHCCLGCAHANGYLDLSVEMSDAVKQKFGWDEVRGFSTNVGCRLPREIRSPICLKFYCGPISIGSDGEWQGGAMQEMREEKGFDKPLLPREMASALYRYANSVSPNGYRRVVAAALQGRISV